MEDQRYMDDQRPMVDQRAMDDPDIQLQAVPINTQGASLADLIYNAEITDHLAGDELADTEQKATVDELASVLLFPEEIPRNSKREFARNLYRSFRSCQTFMSLLGRFPIESSQNEDNSIVFAYNWNSFRGIIFFVSYAILTVLAILSVFNIISTMLNFPKHKDRNVTWDIKVIKDDTDPTRDGKVKWEHLIPLLPYPKHATVIVKGAEIQKSFLVLRAEEMFIFRRNMASLFIILFLLFHILVADYNLYNRRHFVASYLTFWTESVEIMKIDAAGDAKKFTKRFMLYYILWYTLLCCAVVINFAPVTSGAPLSFAFLWVRCFYPSIHSVSDILILCLRIIGGVVFLYIILCSKVYVLFFMYICKILKTACTVWNERLEKVFTQEERRRSRKEKCASRTGYDHLFKDYVTLLDLLSGADTLFANIIESYFAMTLLSIVFEVYYLVRPIAESQREFSQARTFDMVVVALYMFNSLMVFYLVSTGAAEVGEAAANGLEIIRRQGIMGHRSDSEMHFMISLYMSYTGHFDTALSGGGYFILDKGFFVAIAGTMISYIIIIFQFQPALGLADLEQQNLIEIDNPVKLRTLVMHVENTFLYSYDRPPLT